jgi:hypothetical protein
LKHKKQEVVFMAWGACAAYSYPGQREQLGADKCPACTIGTLHSDTLIGCTGEEMLVCGVCQTVLCAVCRGTVKQTDGKHSCCGGLLEKARNHAAEHGETFWDMFSVKQTESRKFFLSLPKKQREFLQYMATIDAAMGD